MPSLSPCEWVSRLQRWESLFRWVWEANRGNPVGLNSTFSFGSDGNLALAESDGRIAWQTNTANKGVVGFKFLPNGNMVLYDSKGSSVWQSFDHSTDTLLVGGYLKAGGPSSKLVSRVSEIENKDGPYSLVLEPKGLALYYKSKSYPSPVLYWSSAEMTGTLNGALDEVMLTSDPKDFDVRLEFQLAKSPNHDYGLYLALPVNNSTLTYLRLGIDGNIRLHTYFVNVRQGVWQQTFSLFDSNSDFSECRLPEKCGDFGLCENSHCIGCPLSSGLVGWTKDCRAKAVTSCRASDFHYYKLEGVEHYMSKYTKGDRVSEGNCGNKCTKDCKCLGYFYNKMTSRCWIAYDLKTLNKVGNSTHLGYIKVPNH